MEKQYTFTITEQCTTLGIVIATSKEEAIEKIKNGDYDDMIDAFDTVYIPDTIEIVNEQELDIVE